MDFGVAQASTPVNGIITQNTTWTKTNSPYSLTGPVLINQNVTLTIEPGVTVNLNGHDLTINGTLTAKGTTAGNIVFNTGWGNLKFTKYCLSWNEETGVGCILENSIVNSTSIAITIGDTTPKINNNTITGAIWTADTYLDGREATSSEPIISNNILLSSNYPYVLQIGTSPIIFNNTIMGDTYTSMGAVTIEGNHVWGSITSYGEYDYIADNVLQGSGSGYGIRTDFTTIERNLITNYDNAIQFGVAGFPTIRNNTLANNNNGIAVPGYDMGSRNPKIVGNNFLNNTEYNINFYLIERYPNTDITATGNWWGTTDQQAINQTIHDYKNDYNLGKVNFVPYLTSPNTQALPKPNVQVPTRNPTATQTPTITATPITPEFPLGISLTIIIILSTIIISATVLLPKNKTKKN